MNNNYAIVFPGQGSQSVGMLGEFLHRFKIVKNTFEEASDVLGYDLLDLSQNGVSSDIVKTEVAQPLILTSSVAIWRLLEKDFELAPACMAGHSLGEWSALTCSDVVAFHDAVALVKKRGEYMQTAVAEDKGAMAAILGLEDHIVQSICGDISNNQIVEAVNFNAPGQVVIAGDTDAVDAAIVVATEKGARRALKLDVSAPFHTSLMRSAADRLEEDLLNITFMQPKFDILHNVNCKTEKSPKAIKELMLEQIYSPVLWSETIHAMNIYNLFGIIECGAGRILTGLVKRIHKDYESFSTDNLANYDKTLTMLKRRINQ